MLLKSCKVVDLWNCSLIITITDIIKICCKGAIFEQRFHQLFSCINGSVFLSFRGDEDCQTQYMSLHQWLEFNTGTSYLCTSGLCRPLYKTVDALAITLKDTLINVVNMTAHHKFWINNQCCYQNIKRIFMKLTWVDPLSAVSVLSSDVTPRVRCLVTGYYYIPGVQLKATDINNTTVPADFKNILTWTRNCRCCCFCRTTNVAAFPWIYVMLYQNDAI